MRFLVWFIFFIGVPQCDTVSLNNPALIVSVALPPGAFTEKQSFTNHKTIFKMVTVTNYHVRQRKNGTNFITLTLTGGLEMVQSQSSGTWKAMVRKCQIPSNLDEPTAKMVIGTQMPGNIVRVQSDPYDYADGQTGEVITLSHTWAYQPEGAAVIVAPQMEEAHM
jgi:hypothetical protein